jgi:hypothetical protein
MKELEKDFYYVVDREEKGTSEAPMLRVWHNCKKYKDRDIARVEISQTEENEEGIKFICDHCGIEYTASK